MKRISFGIAVAAMLGAASLGSSEAQTISIGYSTGGPILTLASGLGSATFSDLPFLTITGGDITGLQLSSLTFSAFLSPGPNYFFVSETGLSFGAPERVSFLSNFTQNVMPSGDSVSEYTFFDPNDTLYGTSTLLGSASWTSSGVPGGTGPDTVLENIYAPYSLTEVYVLSMPIPTQLLSTIDLQTSPIGRAPFVPEPSTWAMLGIGFAGIGLLGAAKRRKAPRYAL
jgi:PEP-CTERM motif